MTDNYVLETLMIYATSFAFIYIANLIIESYLDVIRKYRNIIRGMFLGFGMSITIVVLYNLGMTGYPDGRFSIVTLSASFLGAIPAMITLAIISMMTLSIEHLNQMTFVVANLTSHLILGLSIYYFLKRKYNFLHIVLNMLFVVLGLAAAYLLTILLVDMDFEAAVRMREHIGFILPITSVFAGLISLSMVKDHNKRIRIDELDQTSKSLRLLNESSEKVNQQLRVSEDKYRLFMKASDEGFVEYNHSTKIVKLSDRALDIIDQTLRGHENTLWDVFNILVDDDAKKLQDSFGKMKLNSQEMIDLKLKVKQRNNEPRNIRLTGVMIREHGTIVRVVGTIKDIHDAVMKEEIIFNLAYRDEATQVFNENAFIKDLNELIAMQKTENILFLSIRGYMSYNSVGMEFKNSLRSHFVNILRRFFLADNCYYLQDGVFAVRVHQDIIFEEVQVKYQAMQREFEKPKSIGDLAVNIMMLGTFMTYPLDSEYPEGIISRGVAMLNHQESAKSMELANFKESIYKTQFRANRLDTYIINGIEDDEFYMVYQPQYNEIGHVIGYEALIRWDSDKFGYISPNEFIPVAERNGSIIYIGQFVVRSVCDFAKDFWHTFGRYPRVSINVSFVELINPDYADGLDKILKQYDIPCENIVIEITETAISDFVDIVLGNIEQLCNKGFEIHLDDFGTGYSSLNHLNILPVHTVKIDKSFVDQIVHNSDSRKIVMTIIELCHRIGKKVIAEGIEREEQFSVLKDMACDEYQGYLFSKPLNDYTILEIDKVTKLF